MKNTCIACLLFITSCTFFSTKQQQAERLARAYLDTAVADFNSYQLVKSMPIDTLTAGPDNEPAYQLISTKIDSTYLIADSLNKVLTSIANSAERAKLEQRIKENTKSTNSLIHQSLQYLLNYKGKPNGWILEQTYRLKSGDSSALYSYVFKIDNELEKVVGYKKRKM
jgi:hypothetical protein